MELLVIPNLAQGPPYFWFLERWGHEDLEVTIVDVNNVLTSDDLMGANERCVIHISTNYYASCNIIQMLLMG